MSMSAEDLLDLPQKDGFRLRGLEMTRLETFCDAAFAFATTMLVISVGSIPRDLPELVTALKGAPAFAASFAQIMALWIAHRRWSRRYGLEDGSTTFWSLALIFVMLVYVYPLRLIFSTLFSWISGGRLPSEFVLHQADELPGLFIVYGLGFGAMSAVMALLYRRARTAGGELSLNAREVLLTTQQVTVWTVMAATGLASAAFAAVTPAGVGVWAGFVYSSLPVTMPLLARRYAKKAAEIDG